MSKTYKTACIFGGTGFVGRQIVRELAAKGIRIKIATRVPESAYFLRPCGDVGQVVPYFCDYNDPASIQAAVKGCDYVVNCIGILFERKKNSFARIHTDLPANIAKACADEGVSRFVHISALGIENNPSQYAKTKLEGEKAVLANCPQASILRPSIVFGEDDDFFNKFAKLAGILPFLPLIGGGNTRFQPVYVGDVADAALACLFDKTGEYGGKIFALGGPDIVSFKEVYEILFAHIGFRKPLVSLPWGVANMQAALFSLMPTPLLTKDQVLSLKADSVVSDQALTFADLGITPQAMAAILPEYLALYRPGGRFAHQQSAA
ncbi:MAG: complex I NDUFA9 subunit family protein [Alphaproteobacteria bacterium]